MDMFKTSALNFGFEEGFIEKLSVEHGEDKVALAVEAARLGLSPTVIVEIIKAVGPSILELIVYLLNRRNMEANEQFGLAPAIVNSFDNNFDGPFIDGIIEKYLPIIMKKYLPLIIEKYADQIIKIFVDLFLKNLEK